MMFIANISVMLLLIILIYINWILNICTCLYLDHTHVTFAAHRPSLWDR